MQIADASKQLERVQRELLRFMKYALNIKMHSLWFYSPVLHLPNLWPLDDRREFHNLFSFSVYSSFFHVQINLRVPIRCTHNTTTFFILPRITTNYWKKGVYHSYVEVSQRGTRNFFFYIYNLFLYYVYMLFCLLLYASFVTWAFACLSLINK